MFFIRLTVDTFSVTFRVIDDLYRPLDGGYVRELSFGPVENLLEEEITFWEYIKINCSYV